MKQLFDNVLKEVESVISSKSETTYSFEKTHIFFSLLNYSTEYLQDSEKLDMIYFFNCNEKSIQFARLNLFTLSEHWINKSQDVLSTIVHNNHSRDGMKALYHPAIAYFYYAQKNFIEAIYHQKASIYYLDCLIESGFKDAILAKMEQSLNLIKAYQAEQKTKESENLFQSLFSYILLGQKTSDYLYDWNIVEEKSNDRVGAMIYYYDSIFFKEITRNYDSIFEENSTISSLNTILRSLTFENNTEFRELQTALEAISFYWQGEVFSFLKLVSGKTLLSDRVPNALRFIIAEYCWKIFQEFEYQEINVFEDVLQNLYNDFLYIPKGIMTKRNTYRQNYQLEFEKEPV
jgi:hypothetical protein